MIITDTKSKILHLKSKNPTIKLLWLKTARKKDKILIPFFLFVTKWNNNLKQQNKSIPSLSLTLITTNTFPTILWTFKVKETILNLHFIIIKEISLNHLVTILNFNSLLQKFSINKKVEVDPKLKLITVLVLMKKLLLPLQYRKILNQSKIFI